MNLIPIVVTDHKGEAVSAQKASCPECGNDTFLILVIKGHNHLQCSQCNTSFCQSGECE